MMEDETRPEMIGPCGNDYCEACTEWRRGVSCLSIIMEGIDAKTGECIFNAEVRESRTVVVWGRPREVAPTHDDYDMPCPRLTRRFLQRFLFKPRSRYIPPSRRLQIRKEQNGCCDACGREIDKLETHHVRPFFLGGGQETENIVGLCALCHVLCPLAAESEDAGKVYRDYADGGGAIGFLLGRMRERIRRTS